VSAKPRKLPGNLSHLQRLVNAAAAAASLPVGRYQRWINTHIISAVLDRVRDEEGEPLFTLKGGAAMELRFGVDARASKDYDAAFRARAEDMLDALDRALGEDWGGFQLQRTEPQAIHDTHALRTDIRLHYKGRPWGTVQLEVACRRPGGPGDRLRPHAPAGSCPDQGARADRVRVGPLPDRAEDPRLHRGLRRRARERPLSRSHRPPAAGRARGGRRAARPPTPPGPRPSRRWPPSSASTPTTSRSPPTRCASSSPRSTPRRERRARPVAGTLTPADTAGVSVHASLPT
jgi:hypothetical protein